MGQNKHEDQIISRETLELAKKLGFDWHIDTFHPANKGEHDKGAFTAVTQSMLQKWLRETHNHNIVPVRVPNHMDNGENHRIYLNGREWYQGGLFVVMAGYEACLEAGLQKSLRYLIQQRDEYNRNEQSGN